MSLSTSLRGSFLLLLFLGSWVVAEATKVAVYDADLSGAESKGALSHGAKGIIQALAADTGIAPDAVPDISLERLRRYDVVVIPCMDVRTFVGTPEGRAYYRHYRSSLPTFVEAGGGVLVLSRSLGFNYPWPVTECAFPEVAEAVGETLAYLHGKPETLKPLAPHPVSEGIEVVSLPYCLSFGDAVVSLRIGGQGKVVLADSHGFPVGAVGKYGHGKVVALGLPLGVTFKGKSYEEGIPTEGQQKLLLNAVAWLKGSKPADVEPLVGSAERLIAELSVEAERHFRAVHERLKRLRAAESINDAEPARLEEASQALSDLQKRWKVLRGRHARGKGSPSWEGACRLNHGLRTFAIDLREQSLKVQAALVKTQNAVSARTAAEAERSIPNFLSGYSVQYFGGDWRSIFEKMRGAQMNVVLHHYGHERNWPPAAAKELFPLAQVFGLKWITMRTLGPTANVAREVSTFRKYPSYSTFMVDEPAYTPSGMLYTDKHQALIPGKVGQFRAYVRERVPPEVFPRLDVDAFASGIPPHAGKLDRDFHDEHRVLWSVMGDYMRDQMHDYLTAARRLTKKDGSGVRFAVDITPGWRDLWGPGGSYYSIPAVCDFVLTDIYSDGGYGDRFLLDLLRSRGKKTVLINGWRNTSPISYRRSCLAGLMHAEGVMGFTLAAFYPKRSGWSAGRPHWCPLGWEVACEISGMAAKLEDYLVPSSSVAQVALAYSEKTQWNHYYASWGRRSRYPNYQQALYTRLVRSHVPVDCIFAEALPEPGTLDPYKALILADAECMTAREAEAVRKWVKDGGVLVATAESSRYDGLDQPLADYALGDVFGVRFKEPFVKGRRVRLSQLEQIKTKAIEVTTAHPVLSSLAEGDRIAYQGKAYGGLYNNDIVSAAPDRKVLAKWTDDDSPAVVVGNYGKGACVFTSASWLAYCPDGGWFFTDAISWALARAGAKQAVVVEECPASVEVYLRLQQEERRIVVHLMEHGECLMLDKSKVNYRTGYYAIKETPTQGVKLRARVPEGWGTRQIKAFCPITGEQLVSQVSEGYVSIAAPDFVMYTMIVVQADP